MTPSSGVTGPLSTSVSTNSVHSMRLRALSIFRATNSRGRRRAGVNPQLFNSMRRVQMTRHSPKISAKIAEVKHSG